MNRDSLEELKTEIQKQFDAEAEKKKECEIEMYRLQGKFNLVDELIAKVPEEKPTKEGK